MRIAVNTRLLLHDRMDGIGRFSFETLKQITIQHPEHEFVFIFDRPYHKSFIFADNIIPVVIPPPARHPLLFLVWFELSVPFVLRRYKPDLFLSPDGFLSLKTEVPSVCVIHDLNFEQFPADLPLSVRVYYQRMFPRFALKARRIATVSEYSKQDIITRYGIPPQQIDVVYNGVSDSFKPLENQEKIAVRKQFAHGSEYFFFVGSLHPRKNLINLFKAFDRFKLTDRQGIKLVIAGARMWWTNDIRLTFEFMKFRDDVIFTGRVSDHNLARLMASAKALTYVSYFEGFGIPILEAFNCETPVITSSTTSMPEVAGDAALLVDPFSVDMIASAMQSLAENPALCDELVEKGKKQRNRFSWLQTSEKLWNTIQQTL